MLRDVVMNAAASWIEKVGGSESCSFSRDTENFRQRRIRVLKISILPINLHKIRGFSPKFSIFWQHFSDKKIYQQFSDGPKFRVGNCCCPCHDGTGRKRRCCRVVWRERPSIIQRYPRI